MLIIALSSLQNENYFWPQQIMIGTIMCVHTQPHTLSKIRSQPRKSRRHSTETKNIQKREKDAVKDEFKRLEIS